MIRTCSECGGVCEERGATICYLCDCKVAAARYRAGGLRSSTPWWRFWNPLSGLPGGVIAAILFFACVILAHMFELFW